MTLSGKFKDVVTVYSRHGCHLCEVVVETLDKLKDEHRFEISLVYIDGDEQLEKLYGDHVPVTHINGKHHDFWRIDPERFLTSLETNRLNQ